MRYTMLTIGALLLSILYISVFVKGIVGYLTFHVSILILSGISCVSGLLVKKTKDKEMKLFLKAVGVSMLFFFISETTLIVSSIFIPEISFSLANIFLLFSYVPILFIILKEVISDFRDLYGQIILTILLGLLLSIQYFDFFAQVVNQFSLISASNHLSQIDLFLLVTFLVLDSILFILLLILFSIYSRKAKNHWVILILAYLMLSVSDYYFFKNLIFKNEIHLQVYKSFNVLYLETIFIGIYLIKQNAFKYKTVRDILSEREEYRSLYKELDRVNKQLVTFTNIMKQDLRNDLAVIETAVELLSESNDTMFKEMITDRIEKMREKIFNIGAVEGFLVEDTIRPISLKVLQAAAMAFENVQIIGLDKEIFVKANRFLFSVFYGLIINAFQHGGEHVKVWIEVEEKEEHVFIHIKDDGVGITEEKKNRIFMRDYKDRADTGGMNLFLIKITLDTFGGEIFLCDNNPSGSDFVVKLEKLYTDAF